MHMAADAGIPVEEFQALWMPTDTERTIGKLSFEDAISDILRKKGRYSDCLLKSMVEKRYAIKRDCFEHLHEEIIPMLDCLKKLGIKIGLISNCFSEEAIVIRESVLFPYFETMSENISTTVKLEFIISPVLLSSLSNEISISDKTDISFKLSCPFKTSDIKCKKMLFISLISSSSKQDKQ